MSTETKAVQHTAGPWFVDYDCKSDIYSFAPQEELLASVYPLKRAEGSWQGNARLIAAAPELLDALSRLVFAVEETDELSKGYIRNSQAYKDSKAAIRKAEGQQ